MDPERQISQRAELRRLLCSLTGEASSGGCLLLTLLEEGEALRRQEAFLQAVMGLARPLLRGQPVQVDIPAALGRLGEAAGVTGLSVFRPRQGAGAQPSMGLVHQWARVGAKHFPGRALNLALLPRWSESFAAGRVVAATVADLPPAEQAALAPWAVRSLVAAPVLQAGRLEAMVVFEDAEKERVWSAQELEVFQQGADVIAAVTDPRRQSVSAAVGRSHAQLLLADVRGVAVQALDPAGSIVYWNKGSEQIYGYTAEEVRGQDLVDLLVTPETRELAREVVRHAFETGEVPASHEVGMIRKDGARAWVLRTAQMVRPAGEPPELWTIDFDLTEMKRAQDQTAVLQRQLEGARKMELIAHLVGGVAHHFNNALTVIQGNAELLRKQYPGDRGITELVDQILDAAKGSAQLTSQLLAYTRMDRPQKAPVDVHKLIQSVVEILTTDLELSAVINQDLQAETSVIMGEEADLRSALVNLGINACEAVRDGGEVTFATSIVTLDEAYCISYPYEIEPGRYLRVAVSDTGVGMDEQTLQRAFEPFFTTKPFGQGHGLGLASVYGCAKSHGGPVHLSSAPRTGTTAEVYVPLSPELVSVAPVGPTAPQAVAVTPRAAAPVPQAPPPRRRKTVMVVEDESSALGALSVMLTGAGYDVKAFTSASEAVPYYQQHHGDVDLAVIDMIMPHMNGRETFQRLKAVDPDVKVLLSSSFLLAGDAQAVLEQGAIGFLAKPYQADQVLPVVNQALRDT